MNSELDIFSHVLLPSSHNRSVEENWILFRNKVSALVNQYVPLIKITNDKSNPWFTRSLRLLQNGKKHHYDSAKCLRTQAAWDKYKENLKTCCSALSSAKNKYFTHDLPSLLKTNPRKFWSIISPDQDHNTISLHNNNTPLPDIHCASAFNTYFSSIFTTEDQSDLPDVPKLNYRYMSLIEITVESVASLINNLKLTRSCGVNDGNSKIRKNTNSV